MKVILLCYLIINTNAAQDNVRIATSTDVAALLPAIQIDAYHSIGFSNITHCQIAEIGSSNPANLKNFNEINAGIGFQYNNETDYVLDFKLERPKQWIPSAFGFVYPLNDFRFALSYHQKYSSFIDLGEMEIRTVLRPEGTGEFWEASNEMIIYSPAALFSYSLPYLIFSEDKLTLGGQLFWNFWESEEKIFNTSATINTNDISWKVGIKYDLNPNIGFGLLFENGINMEGEVNIKSGLHFISPIDTTRYFAAIPVKFFQNFKLPDKFSFGFQSQIINKVIIISNMTVVFWNSLNKAYKDQLDFSAATQIKLSQIFHAVFGLYFTDRKLENEESYFTNPRHATFYSLGLKANYKNFTFVTEFLNTTAASAKYREQSIYKLQINYSFNN